MSSGYLLSLLPNYFFSPALALALGEGDAAAAGLAAGLGFTAGVVVAGAAGVAAVAGVGVAAAGAVELVSGSVAQPVAKAIESIIRPSSARRLNNFTFGVVIGFPRSRKIEKRDDDCSSSNLQQWVFPQKWWRDLRFVYTARLVFKSVLARLVSACV